MKSKQPVASAAALYYDGQSAPTVTASARGDVADEIISLATDHCIPIYENAELSEILVQLELGDEIPEALYITVAEASVAATAPSSAAARWGWSKTTRSASDRDMPSLLTR